MHCGNLPLVWFVFLFRFLLLLPFVFASIVVPFVVAVVVVFDIILVLVVPLFVLVKVLRVYLLFLFSLLFLFPHDHVHHVSELQLRLFTIFLHRLHHEKLSVFQDKGVHSVSIAARVVFLLPNDQSPST